MCVCGSEWCRCVCVGVSGVGGWGQALYLHSDSLV